MKKLFVIVIALILAIVLGLWLPGVDAQAPISPLSPIEPTATMAAPVSPLAPDSPGFVPVTPPLPPPDPTITPEPTPFCVGLPSGWVLCY